MQYHYDAANRLDSITSPAGTFSIGYDTLSRRSTLAYPHSITANYGYDDLNRLTDLTHHSLTGQAIASASYSHDQAGNRISKESAPVGRGF
jgi:uncharacterized protein RhaS with RHS repeats